MRVEELLKQKSRLEQYFRRSSPKLSAYSFINLLAWTDFFDFDFKEIDGNLLVFAKDQAGIFLYVMPLGERLSSQAVDVAFDLMKDVNGQSRLSRIENVDEHRVKFFSEARYDIHLKCREICCYREDIAGLKGNDYKSQRAAFNQFVKTCQYQYLPYENRMKTECLELFHRWKSKKERVVPDDVSRLMLEDSEQVHRRALEAAPDLELAGRVVTVDGKIEAYTFGYALNQNTFCVLFEIANVAVKGISSFIFSQFCQDRALKDYKFINVMDDFGLARVNQTKMSYHPVLLYPSYTVTQRL